MATVFLLSARRLNISMSKSSEAWWGWIPTAAKILSYFSANATAFSFEFILAPGIIIFSTFCFFALLITSSRSFLKALKLRWQWVSISIVKLFYTLLAILKRIKINTQTIKVI